MLDFFVKTTTSKSFYNIGFKKISRTKTVLYTLLIIVSVAAFITPIVSYKYFSIYKDVKDQLLNIPSKLVVSYTPEAGLTTNTQYPIILEFKGNNYIVLDTKSNYKKATNDATEVVLKNKGYAVYSNGEIVDQQKYMLGEGSDFKIEFREIKERLEKVLDPQVYLYMVIFFGIYYGIATFVSVIFVCLLFGSITYIAQKGQKNSITLAQSIKKIMFLSPYYVLGYTLNEVFSNPLPGLGIVLLLLGFLFTNKVMSVKSK